MKILDEYVIILNILLFLLLLYNFLQKIKIIEGHDLNPHPPINNEGEGKSLNKEADNMIQQVVEKEEEAKNSNTKAKKNYKETKWDKHIKAAEERDKKITALNN